jgi:hypothetical protein
MLRRFVWTVLIAAFLTGTLWFVVTQPTGIARPQAANLTVDSRRLEDHVRALSENFSPRDWQHPENLDRAAAYIGRELEAAKGVVSEQPYEMAGSTYRNVIAVFGPPTPERIVVGAHYDAHDEFPGSDDNASGVAGLIELAHLLGATTLPMRVELVAYTLEESRRPQEQILGQQYDGSAVHAASLKERDIPVRLMLSLEMIGFFSDGEESQGYPSPILEFFYPSQANFIVVAGRIREGWAVRRIKKAMQEASPLPVYSFNAPSFVAGINRSDHANYWVQGYPAALITDTSFYRNPYYHTAQDSPETLDYNRMAMVVQGVLHAVVEYAR